MLTEKAKEKFISMSRLVCDVILDEFTTLMCDFMPEIQKIAWPPDLGFSYEIAVTVVPHDKKIEDDNIKLRLVRVEHLPFISDIRIVNSTGVNKLCPFCRKYPKSIKSIYPNAPDKLTCPTNGCPASGNWVTPDVWNRRG